MNNKAACELIAGLLRFRVIMPRKLREALEHAVASLTVPVGPDYGAEIEFCATIIRNNPDDKQRVIDAAGFIQWAVYIESCPDDSGAYAQLQTFRDAIEQARPCSHTWEIGTLASDEACKDCGIPYGAVHRD